MERESIEFDILFVGGGPAGLAGAIQLLKLAQDKGMEIEVAMIEKGAEIGSHALSGAILNPGPLQELIPDYLEKGCPIENTVRADEFYYLTSESQYRLPVVPKHMHNQGHHIISLARFTRWLAEIAESMGLNIFPGFTGKEVLYGKDGKTIIGVRTGDKGLDRDGKPRGNFEPGIDILSKITVFGEGARGSLTKAIDKKLSIFPKDMPQVFETGIKEVIQLPEGHYFSTSKGNDIHTLGYPLNLDIPGGGFIYEMSDNRVAIGFLVGLSYEDPTIDPYDEFILFKKHPFIARIIKGGKVIEQGARTVSTGGYYAMPKLTVDGAMFIGGCAGFHNVPGLKGIHISMKSGMLAAETALDALQKECYTEKDLENYRERFESSDIREEMVEGRNFAQALAKKMPIKLIHLGAQYFTKGLGFRDPLPLFPDHLSLLPVDDFQERTYPAKADYDGSLYVDKLTGVFLSKTLHREDQPSHIIIHDPDLCINQCYPKYRSPCTRFCPGNVYEIKTDELTSRPMLKLNPSNCLHCKTCDIKDPYENITWTCPEGGEGPGYTVV